MSEPRDGDDGAVGDAGGVRAEGVEDVPHGSGAAGDDAAYEGDGHDTAGGPEGDELIEAPRPRRAARITAVAVAVVMVALVGGLVVVLGDSDAPTDREAPTPLEDQAVPEVQAPTLDGGRFDIDDHRGSWVLVNFFSTWCRPCRTEHPELVSLDEAYGDRGDITVVSVIYADRPEDVARFFEQEGGDWPILRDPDGRIAVDFGTAKVPETYLVDPDGIVRKRLIGGVTRAGIEQDIVELGSEVAGEQARGSGA